MNALMYRGDLQTIVLGSRLGHVDVFRITSESGKRVSRFIIYTWRDAIEFYRIITVIKIQSLVNLHSKEGVTDILFHNNLLYSAGKDGYCCELEMASSGKLSLRSRSRISRKMDWIQKLEYRNKNLIAVGFYKKNFMVFDETRKCEVRRNRAQVP
jgi:hypothetical protein